MMAFTALRARELSDCDLGFYITWVVWEKSLEQLLLSPWVCRAVKHSMSRASPACCTPIYPLRCICPTELLAGELEREESRKKKKIKKKRRKKTAEKSVYFIAE